MGDRIVTDWLYQFWFFAFKTAKHWGRGPQEWNIQNIRRFLEAPIGSPQADTSISLFREFIDYDHHQAYSPLATSPRSALKVQILKPPSLCRWSIHCDPESVKYDGDIIVDVPSSNSTEVDPADMSSWHTWSKDGEMSSLEGRLLDGLKSNEFSGIDGDNLPLAIPQFVNEANIGDDQILEEALGFAIISRNQVLVEDIIYKLYQAERKLSRHYPLHLATTYLDGSQTCCNIVNYLRCEDMWYEGARVPNNDFDHTVFDSLMLTILRSHTSVTPGAVDRALQQEHCFPGGEVDICGRWDADSPSFRSLLSSGSAAIPIDWKHKFCHTSALTICHCIDTINFEERPSGLFLNYCESCGLKLQLKVFHLITVVAFKLANSGTAGEDLFGIIAVLLYCLRQGQDHLDEVNISPTLVFGLDHRTEEPDGCKHRPLTAYGLAAFVPEGIITQWPNPAQVGWRLFCRILECSEEGYRLLGNHEYEGDLQDYDIDCFRCHSLGRRSPLNVTKLGVLFAAVQTELLTYRRLDEDSPWISKNFDMKVVIDSLASQEVLNVGGLVEKKLMENACRCGTFAGSIPHRAEDVCAEDFTNLQKDPSLVTYILPPYSIIAEL